jgi:hypothetical protein
MTIDLNATSGSVDLTSPPTPIGSVTPVAVTSTIFTASPANNTSSLVTGTPNSLTGSNAQSLVNLVANLGYYRHTIGISNRYYRYR